MCCEERHICTHCGYLISSRIDRCRFAVCSDDAFSRDPGTEIGMAAEDWCPEGEWIVEDFMHQNDGACPKCASSTNLRVFPVDSISGEVVHPPMALASPSSPTSSSSSNVGGDTSGAVSPSSSGDEDDSGKKVAQKSGGGGFASGWRVRFRNMVNRTRPEGATTGKRHHDTT